MFRESAKMWIFSEYFCGFFKLFCWHRQSDRIFRFFTNCGCLYLVAICETIFLVHLQDPGKVSAFGQKPGGKNPDFHISRCYMTTQVLAIVVIALRSRRYRSCSPPAITPMARAHLLNSRQMGKPSTWGRRRRGGSRDCRRGRPAR